MRFFEYPPPRKFAPAGEPEGGGTGVLDAATPHEHDEDSDEVDDVVEKTPDQKRIEALEADLAAERSERQRAADDAKFWAGRGRREGSEESGERVGETEDELTVEEQAAATLRDSMKPEEWLEMLTKEGPKALEKLGFVTGAQLKRAVAEAEERGAQRVGQMTADQRYEATLNEEYPDIVADSNRVKAGERPQSKLFTRTGEIYRAAVADDPALKGSKSLLLMATRQAAAELGIKKGGGQQQQRTTERDAPRGENRPSRRDRVDAQRPPVSREETRDDEDGPSTDQLHVAKMLGVSQKEIVKHRGNGRPGGGRRG